MTERLVAESWDWPDLLASEHAEEVWWVDQLIPANGRVLIEAPQESFKSTFLQQLAICVTTGTDFIGLHTDKARKAVYLQCEGDLNDTTLRGIEMHKWLPVPDAGMLSWDFLLRRKLNTKAGLQALTDICEQHGLDEGVLFIDPVYKTIRGKLTEDDVVGEWTDNVDFVLSKFKSSCVVAHHEVRPTTDAMGTPTRTEPGARTFGSMVWQAWPSYGYQLKRLTGRAKGATLTCWKARRPTALDGNPLALTLLEPHPFGLERTESGVSSTMATIRAMLRIEGVWLSKAELAERMRLSLPPIQQAVEALMELGWLTEDDGRPRRYAWSGLDKTHQTS